MKMEGSTTPSSSSNHVVLERLNGGKSDKKLETGDLPSLGEDDIHNVIGSCKYYSKLKSTFHDNSKPMFVPISVGYLSELHGERRQDDGGPGGGKSGGWMIGDSGYSHNQITAHRTHAFTTGQSYSHNQPNGNILH